jgi:hypothetical protein
VAGFIAVFDTTFNQTSQTTITQSRSNDSSPVVTPYFSQVTADGQSASLSVRHPSWAHDHIFITIRQLRGSPREEPSLTRGWLCSLQLLLELASTLILRPESLGTHHCIFCLKFETTPTYRARFPYLRVYPPETGLSSYTPRHRVTKGSFPKTLVGVGVLLAADSQSTSVSGYRASLWGP